MQFFTNVNIDFIGRRKVSYLLSATIILIGIISLIYHGGPRYNIDFTGGTLIHLKFKNPVEIEKVRSALSMKGYGDSEITHFGSENDVLIRAGIQRTDEELFVTIEKIISDVLPDNPFETQRIEKVGPKIGEELIVDAILAIFWAMLFILIYVIWRFELKYALGAIIALIHDVIITVGIFSLLGIEISVTVVAAVLTIVGYSLNDTIVVFDRIRENLKVAQKDMNAFIAIFNKSINETLSRTVITSLTTLFVVLILFFFGGEVLRSFALALIIGIIVGTYSSIFVASPFVVDWQLRKSRIK
jgi:preprotein translocase subunit SecF